MITYNKLSVFLLNFVKIAKSIGQHTSDSKCVDMQMINYGVNICTFAYWQIRTSNENTFL